DMVSWCGGLQRPRMLRARTLHGGPGPRRARTHESEEQPRDLRRGRRPSSSGYGEAFASTGAERTWVLEHRSAAETKPKLEIGGRPGPLRYRRCVIPTSDELRAQLSTGGDSPPPVLDLQNLARLQVAGSVDRSPCAPIRLLSSDHVLSSCCDGPTSSPSMGCRSPPVVCGVWGRRLRRWNGRERRQPRHR